MAFRDIIGQDMAINILLRTIQRGRLPSSYLFIGESGIGKKFTAINLAKAVNCLNPPIPPLEKGGKGGFEKAFENTVNSFREKFQTAMDDDFNTALGVGHIFELIREANKYLDSKPSGQKAKELVSKTMELLKEAGSVLNIFRKTPDEWQTALMRTKKIPLTETDMLNRIKAREEARQKKDWAAADTIRKELDEKGIILEDKKDGTGWKIKAG